MRLPHLAMWLVLAVPSVAAAADWPVFGHDPAHSGAVYNDRAISTSTVARLRFQWHVKLGDVADSTPILISRVTVNGKQRPLLFQTAKNGTTYGIDARTGAIVWRFASHGPNITTSTPAADPAGRWIYAPGVDGFVHKLDAAGGAEIRDSRFPLRVTLMPESEKDASPLNVANGYLYAVTSGYFGDAPPYDGHVVSVRLSDGATHVFNTLCSEVRSLPAASSCSRSGSGIWARAGAVVDPDPSMHGRLYLTTGNGDFNAHSGGHDYGDSVLALTSDGASLLDYYTPQSYDELQSGDTDLGSTSPALLPREPHSRTPLMLVQGGKDEVLRLLDRARLPGIGGELQRIDIGAALYSAPAVWQDPSRRTWVFLGLSSALRAYRLQTDSHGTSRLVHGWDASVGESLEGSSPIVIGSVVFVAANGALHAIDARTGRELWNSARTGHSIAGIHWQSPILVDGWLYCADEDGYLTAYAIR